MRNGFLLYVTGLFLALSCLPAYTQQPEPLGDAARRLRAEKEAASKSLDAARAAALDPQKADVLPHITTGPITQLQLFTWLAAEMASEDLVFELHNRGIAFEPDDLFSENLASVTTSASIAGAVHAARRTSDSQTTNSSALSAIVSVGVSVKNHDYDEALLRMRPLFENDPQNPDLYFALGNIFKNLDYLDRETWALSRAVELAPAFPYSHGQLSFAYYQMDDSEDAIREARAMLKLVPNSSDAHKFLGLAFFVKNDYVDATVEYTKALLLNPKNANVHYDVGVLWAAQNQWEMAIPAYQKAISLETGRWFYYNNLGIALGHAGRVEEAVATFQKGMAIAPGRPEILQSYGAMLCRSGSHEEAISVFSELLQANPEWNSARPCLYNALMKMGRTEDAKKVKEDYIQYSPDHRPW